MIDDMLKARGEQYGNFHTQANLTQTLNTIIQQHYRAIHTDDKGNPEQMPQFMAEAIHMICHKLGRIANGNPYYDDSWKDIAGYSQLVVDILKQAQAQAQAQAEKVQEAPPVSQSPSLRNITNLVENG